MKRYRHCYVHLSSGIQYLLDANESVYLGMPIYERGNYIGNIIKIIGGTEFDDESASPSPSQAKTKLCQDCKYSLSTNSYLYFCKKHKSLMNDSYYQSCDIARLSKCGFDAIDFESRPPISKKSPSLLSRLLSFICK